MTCTEEEAICVCQQQTRRVWDAMLVFNVILLLSQIWANICLKSYLWFLDKIYFEVDEHILLQLRHKTSQVNKLMEIITRSPKWRMMILNEAVWKSWCHLRLWKFITKNNWAVVLANNWPEKLATAKKLHQIAGMSQILYLAHILLN